MVVQSPTAVASASTSEATKNVRESGTSDRNFSGPCLFCCSRYNKNAGAIGTILAKNLISELMRVWHVSKAIVRCLQSVKLQSGQIFFLSFPKVNKLASSFMDEIICVMSVNGSTTAPLPSFVLSVPRPLSRHFGRLC